MSFNTWIFFISVIYYIRVIPNLMFDAHSKKLIKTFPLWDKKTLLLGKTKELVALDSAPVKWMFIYFYDFSWVLVV